METSPTSPSKQGPSSPMRTRQFHQLNPEKKEILMNLQNLFIVYSSRSSKHSYKEMKATQFTELLKDIWRTGGKDLARTPLILKDLQGVFYTFGRTAGLNFNKFLDTIPKIAIFIEGTDGSVKILLELMVELYDREIAPELNRQILSIKSELDHQTSHYASKLAPDFRKIYKIYFQNETSNKFDGDPIQHSFKCACNLLKDFEVFPKLVSAGHIYILYEHVLRSPIALWVTMDPGFQQLGEIFIYSKFVEFMAGVSRLCLRSLKERDNPELGVLSQKETLKSLLEYMELVRTFKNRTTKFKEHRFSFLPSEEYAYLAEEVRGEKSTTNFGQARFMEVFKSLEL